MTGLGGRTGPLSRPPLGESTTAVRGERLRGRSTSCPRSGQLACGVERATSAVGSCVAWHVALHKYRQPSGLTAACKWSSGSSEVTTSNCSVRKWELGREAFWYKVAPTNSIVWVGARVDLSSEKVNYIKGIVSARNTFIKKWLLYNSFY